MNCRTCQYELSQCLDGRLASGRRAVVMDHVATCTTCDAFWQELQQAQALVLRLSRQRVGTDFRAQLFERIETGEGTPPAVFAEPVPFQQKARYILTGAAAAAAVLVVATLMRNQPRIEPQAPELVARITPPSLPPSMPPPEARTAFQNTMPGLRPLTADLVAVEAAKQFEEHHDRATHCLALLDEGKIDVAMALKVCDDAAELKNLGAMLLDLRDARVLNFEDPQVDVDLRVVVKMLDDDRLRVRGIETVRTMVAPALRNSRSLGRLTASVTVAPSLDPERLLRFTRSFPHAIDKFFVVVPDGAGFEDLDPRELIRARFFTDECGPVFVVLRNQQREFFGQQTLQWRVQTGGQGGARGGRIEVRAGAAAPAGGNEAADPLKPR